MCFTMNIHINLSYFFCKVLEKKINKIFERIILFMNYFLLLKILLKKDGLKKNLLKIVIKDSKLK